MNDINRHWLNPARIRTYSATVLVSLLIVGLRSAWSSWKLYGMPNGFDFVTFWAASRLTLDGTPLKTYSITVLAQTAKLISPHIIGRGAWFYPPTFLLLVRPLALLPGPISYLVFVVVTTTIFVYLLRKVLPMSLAFLPIIAFPGLWINAVQGQNACLTASLALGAFLLLRRRPILAGVCIGMLAIKPHLAILFPLALACAGMWAAFIAAAVTVVLFTGLSIVVFGTTVVPMFLHSLHDANYYIANGALPWAQMASVFAMLRQVHIGIMPAYVAQACMAIAAASAVIWVWRNSQELEVQATALVAGTFMCSPYLLNYDAVWLGIPIVLISAKALQNGWLSWEREILLACWLYPVVGYFTGYGLHLDIGPIIFAALLFVAIRRTHRQKYAPARDQATYFSICATPLRSKSP